MNTYIAKIKNHRSIIYLASDSKDTIKWAIALKCDIYGEDSELVSIWNHNENKYIEIKEQE